MKGLTVLFFSLLSIISTGYAQKISGTVVDADQKPMEKASVALLRAKDSSIVKMDATKKDGKFDFIGVPSGSYLIRATSVGYAVTNSKVFSLSEADVMVPDIVMDKANTQLSVVTVTARKPLVEVKPDKMVVNVEGTINATGNDALELLRKSPGVMVDKDENISMAGKNGVAIYIDGKPSPLSGTDLANYLKTLQSSSIESIELITNPSAKYEAAGNAGIINIKLKKDKSLGTNGSVNAGYNIGWVPKYNAGISLNHRNKKVNIFGNYNFSDFNMINKQAIYRELADSVFDQSGKMRGGFTSHTFKAGLDYFISKKSTIGVMANGTLSKNGFSNNATTSIYDLATKTVDKFLKANTDLNSDRTNINFNANYKYADTSGHELNVDADYGFYDLHNSQYIPNYYYGPDGVTETGRKIYRTYAPTNIDIYSIKADYEQRLGKGKLGYGGKIGFVETRNDFRRYDVIGITDLYDSARSNNFTYRENVNAAYVNYNRAFKGFTIQLGLRAENTNSDGRAIGKKWNSTLSRYQNYDSTTSRNYIDFFPSASISFNKNPMSQFSINYSRRIDRPRYENLNPFEFKLDDYTFMKGNTLLKPQYTNSFGITHTYKYKLTTSLNYSHVRNMFVQVFEKVETSKLMQTTRNLATQDVISLNVSYPFIYKTFTSFSNLNSNYSMYNANFDTYSIKQNAFTLTYYVQNSLKFGKKKDWTTEVTGLYISPFIWAGTFKGKAMGSVDAGLQKTVLKGKGTVKASVSDIFKTMHFRGESNYGGIYSKVNANWESRQFKINFTYRFGSNQVKSSRQRNTGMDDENKRAAGGGSNTIGQ